MWYNILNMLTEAFFLISKHVFIMDYNLKEKGWVRGLIMG